MGELMAQTFAVGTQTEQLQNATPIIEFLGAIIDKFIEKTQSKDEIQELLKKKLDEMSDDI